MKSFTRVLGGGLAAGATAALLAASFAVPAHAAVSPTGAGPIAPTPGATQINLVGFNDFHGRITTADVFGATVLQAQAPYGEDGTIILGNGDQVGASIFESAILNDEPSIAALNALGVESFTLGNHEFDKGAADAVNRIQSETAGPDLAANVTDATGAHPFGEYAMFTVNGISVAVIGAVTSEVPALVSPSGIAGYSFGDPVEAVNRVAGQLSDGDPANGEAQVIIASYHEGGPVAGNDKLATNLANSTFAHLVNDTVPAVDAIFNAHTHMPYAYDAPIGSGTRPVIQADAYGASIAQVVLTVDPATGAVTATDSKLIPALKAVPAELAGDSRILEIQRIIAQAKQEAGALGEEVIATQQGDLTRAKICEPGSVSVAADGTTSGCAVTTADDRANESSLGRVVAQSMFESVLATGRPVDLALMNPGGLRADILDNDGKVTYKEAASVLPFANTITMATLTGADLKAILEQQWQPAGSSRPYLQLGISDALTYTYDPARPAGDRILSMAINGSQVGLDDTYHVAAPNFLTAGGDNFFAFTNSSHVEDTGLIDLESFVEWVKGKGELPITQTRSGVLVPAAGADDATSGFPYGETVAPGATMTIDASRFDLASLGYIQNSSVRANLVWRGMLTTPADPCVAGSEPTTVPTTVSATVGTASISADAPDLAAIDVTIPADVRAAFADAARVDSYTLELVFAGSNTTAYLPLTIDAGSDPAPVAEATACPTEPVDGEAPGSGDGDGAPADAAAPGAPGAPGSLAQSGIDAFQALSLGIVALLAVSAGALLLVARRRGA